MYVTILSPPVQPAEAGKLASPLPKANLLDVYFSRLRELTAKPSEWDRNSYLALASIFLLWGFRFYSTWATWGLISVDVGREMYVPAMLANGKMLYRDVFYGYMPLGPYFNSWLFRLFGAHLNVLYWSGSLSALACALLLFATAKTLGSTLVGWTVAAVILMQSFHGWLFSFPLSYSFPSVYGCVAACVCLFCIINAAKSKGLRWIVAAANAAALAFLIKLEFGAACYLALLALLFSRALLQKQVKRTALEVACALPGMLAIGMTAAWMISIRGFEFITQENLSSTWPGSYFLRTYGKIWLQQTGLAITGSALLQSFLHTLFAAGILLEFYLLFRKTPHLLRKCALSGGLVAVLAIYFVYGLHQQWLPAVATIFFPQDMILYIGVGALLAYRRAFGSERMQALLPIALVATFASLLAARTLLSTLPLGYSIYYNGPSVLAFLLLVRPLVPRENLHTREIFRSEVAICLGCLAVASVYAARMTPDASDRSELLTERGNIFVSNQAAANYQAAIQLMKNEAAAGRYVLSVPEDTSLYFLSKTEAPARLYFFAPGMLAPGKMTDEIIKEIDAKPIRYVLWSSRTFEEYGAPRFGVDFDQRLGDYITSHFHRAALLVPGSDLDWQTRFSLWERNTDSQ
jgi:hypothetical protein